MGTVFEKIRPRRPLRLLVERLEGRDLPTAPALLAGPVSSVNLGSLLAQAGPQATATVPHLPTPHELARQKFAAKFSGSFITGRGRFSDQASQTFIKGGGTSNDFLHGDLQMAVYTPIDPAGETTGIAALIVKNVSNSGNLLILDLRGDTASLDHTGRPTRFTWTVNGSSGGTFSGAAGEGTVEIRYRPGGKLAARAGVIFRGRIETNGVTNVLR
jgi:hypothetical protein